MKRFAWARFFATLGPIGYLPAPGTCGTIVTLPLVVLMRFLQSDQSYALAVIIILLLSLQIIKRALFSFGYRNDPSEIVLDELVGCLVTFIGIPISWQTLCAGFVLFRFFDISKCCGIRRLEHLNGSWGIVVDDVAAALLSNGILHLGYYLLTA